MSENSSSRSPSIESAWSAEPKRETSQAAIEGGRVCGAGRRINGSRAGRVLGETPDCAVRAMDCRDSWRGDAEESFRPPAPFRRGIPRARLHVAFCFQPIESGIDGADRNFSLRANLDLAANGDAVGLVIQTQNRE